MVSAVECAITWQSGAAGPIAFRIGVHLGDVVVEGDDLFGDGVNITSRVEGMADPGGMCTSEDAQRQVRGKLDLPFEEMGERPLKNITAPIRVFRLGGVASEAAPATAPGHWDAPRILLIPFRQRGEGGASIADGLRQAGVPD